VPDPHPVDARPQALAGWDAWDGARRDEAEDAEDLQGLHLARADGVGKLAGREPDARERHASHRRLEPRVEPEAGAQPDVRELCKPVAVQFEERSCAGLAARELLALPQLEVLMEVRSRWLPEARAQRTLALVAAQRDALEALLQAEKRLALKELTALPGGA
jgi:hypothetical protein